MFELETGEDTQANRCMCCGIASKTTHGFIYKDAHPYAVYYAGWAPNHQDREVIMVIAIGEWDPSATADQRTCFGLEASEGEQQIVLRFIDPEGSPWAHTDLLGSMIRREDALKHPLAGEALSLAETIIRGHPSVREFLAAER